MPSETADSNQLWVPTVHETIDGLEALKQHSGRLLTYPNDRLEAILGVISNLEERWTWPFAASLPLPLLDLALL